MESGSNRIRLAVAALLAASVAWSLPAFPGAEGWGADTPGGRGPTPSATPPKILIVTNTNASGAGSFMEALMTKGPRIIVFNTSGVIKLNSSYGKFEPTGEYGYVTIAGQTSPGGITLTGTMSPPGLDLSVWWCYLECQKDYFHDGVFRFLRIRGDNQDRTAISVAYSHDFIFDHCDFSGGGDGQGKVASFTHNWNFTLQWNTTANPIVCENNLGCQTYGTLLGYKEAEKISLHHNLWAHLEYRAPDLHWLDTFTPPDNGLIDYRNNLIYNVEIPFWLMPEGPALTTPLYINAVSNYYKEGPEGLAGSSFLKIQEGEVKMYGEDNYQDMTLASASGNTGRSDVKTPHQMPAVTTTSAKKAYENVLNKVGAFPRDPMNVRTLNEVRTRTGKWGKIDDAMITTGPAPSADGDKDGMPDFWETAMGLNPADASDAVKDKDGDGYLNIEEYVNDLASARLCEEYQNPVYPIPTGWPDYDPGCTKAASIKPGTGYAQGRSIRSFRVPGRAALFRFELSDRESAPAGSLRILDAGGRVRAALPAGPVVEWTGKDDSGRRLAPGPYFLEWRPLKGPAVRANLPIAP